MEIDKARDHPRLRGNYSCSDHLNTSVPGSSPLTRELLYTIHTLQTRNGITPAYAGTTTFHYVTITFYWDHPRLRGNYFFSIGQIVEQRGSPPLTRELHLHSSKLYLCLRITPAYAGTTSIRFLLKILSWDHPRLRGNYIPFFNTSGTVTGSPPLTRELPSRFLTRLKRSRITPAYAGTTILIVTVCIFFRDHPRLRGNYFTVKGDKRNGAGSPPLTRELQWITRGIYGAIRITPAYAGTTH